MFVQITVLLLCLFASGCVCSSSASSAAHTIISLEELAHKYNAPHRHDYYNYVDTYESIFRHQRHQQLNITVAGGISVPQLHMWHTYFGNSHIFGLDNSSNIDTLKKYVNPGH